MPLVKGHYKDVNPDWLRAGSPSGTFAESIPKVLTSADLTIGATGVELSVAIPLAAGDLVTSITFVTASVAAATPTAGYVCLRTPAGVLLAQSADLGSTARAANTAYTVPLAAPFAVRESTLYRIGISFTAGTVPTLRGVNVAAPAVSALGAVSALTHGSGVGAVAPATTVSPSNAVVIPYFLVS